MTVGHPSPLHGLGEEIFDSLPSPTLIVNGDVGVLHANRAARVALGLEGTTGPVLGRGGGELLDCIHSFEDGDCGRQEVCQDCVIRNAVRTAFERGAVHRSHATLELRSDAGVAEASFLVSAAPIDIRGETQVILTLEDVTAVDRLKREVGRSAKVLQESQERPRRVFHSMSEAFALHEIVLDDAGVPCDYRFLEVNPAFERMTGLTGSQVVGRRVTEVLPGADLHWIETYGRVALTGEPARLERFEPKLGRRFEVVAFRPAPMEFATLFLDVTERRLADEALATSEDRFRALIERSTDAIVVVDEKGRVTFASPAFQAITGVSPAEAMGRPVFEFSPPEDEPKALKVLHEAIRNPGIAQRARVRVRRPDGSLGLMDSSITNLLAVPSVRGVVINSRDITERAEAKRIIRDRDAQLRAYFDSPAVGIAVTSPGKGWTEANERICSMLGYSREELFRMTWQELTHPDDLAADMAEFDRVLAGAIDRYSLDKRILRKDGSILWALVSVSCVRRPDGRIDYVVAILKDITERKQIEQALQVSEARHRLLADNALDVVWTMSIDGRITYLSPAVEKLRGFTVDEAMRQPIEEIHPPESAAISLGYFRRLHADMAAGRPPERFRGELEYRCKDGSTVWTEVITLPVVGPDGTVTELLGVSRDLTERKQAEKAALAREAALRESENRFRTLTNAAPVGVFQADAQGNNVFMNPAMERIMGMSAQEARGKGWMETVHPEDRERVFQEWMAAIAEGRDFTSDYRFLAPSGRACWVRGYGAAIRDRAGVNTGYMAVVVDITEQRAMEQRLAVASRLASMGTLVAGVAHEINNPMTGIVAGLGTAMGDIRGDLERLERGERPAPETSIEKDRELLEMLGDASDAAAKIARIVRDLSVFGAPTQERTRLRPADIVAGAMRWLPAHVHAMASVSVEGLGAAPDVTVARGQLEQVLVNLVTNAARATRPGTRGTIRVRIGPGSPGMARLEVIDQGTGIEPAILPRIFDPFFTTRPAGDGRGAGLGLAICHTIVDDHGGSITVESEVGKGSTFRVELPAAPAEG